jgi:acyl-CoA thioesterase FadM
MSPRRGGEADKFGNRYEGRWCVRQVLDVLAGRAASIVVEEVGEGGMGVEFSLVRNDGTIEAHQVKRQQGNANEWSIANLSKNGVLSAALKQVRLGRRFHFVSIIPSRPLDELSDRARRADDLQSFVDDLGKELSQDFNTFKTAIGAAEDAFIVLQGLVVRWPDERDVRATNAVLAGLLVSGAPGPAAAVVLGDLVLENLGYTLDASKIREKLGEYELATAQLIGVASVAEAVRAIYTTWQASIERDLLHPLIPRHEADEIGAVLGGDGPNLILAVGAAGAGKSAVLHQAVSGVAGERPVLALRLDRIEPFSSTYELGVERLGLPASPVASLAAVAGENECLLVVDQLDAVSRASGRMPQTFEAVAELLREAAAFPAMRVLLACRQFDIDNDDRLRGLVTKDDAQVMIPPLSEQQVTDAVLAMGLVADVLTGPQRELLSSPLHLVLLHAIADQDDALGFSTSKDLLDAYWERKRRDCTTRRQTSFGETIDVLVNYMSEHQRLAAPEAILDVPGLLEDADVLASEHVLVRVDHKINFFHEAFFDYAFARLWIVRGESLVEFLRAGEQELFRRAQVRQVLTHLRDDDPERFIQEIRELLDEKKIRFHIKEVVLAILRALPDPTQAEWQLVSQELTVGHAFAPRLWTGLRTGPWFLRLARIRQ